jgi:hypothetical protein
MIRRAVPGVLAMPREVAVTEGAETVKPRLLGNLGDN